LAILIAVFLLGLQFALFAFGYMKANAVALDTVGFAAGAVLLIVASRKRKKMSTYAPQELMMRHCISYITMGAVAGLVVGFFAGTFLLSEFLMLLRSIGLSIVLTFEGYATVGLTAGTVIGGVAGYLLYRRSKYSKITTSTHVPNQTPHGAFKRGVLS
jgi:glycopeptide antibiotics resistance protein